MKSISARSFKHAIKGKPLNWEYWTTPLNSFYSIATGRSATHITRNDFEIDDMKMMMVKMADSDDDATGSIAKAYSAMRQGKRIYLVVIFSKSLNSINYFEEEFPN